MIVDLKNRVGMNGNTELLVLVDKDKRITSSSFNVWIPSLMSGIPMGVESVSKYNSGNCLNDINPFVGEVNLGGSLLAQSIHGYRFKHEGWIPEFKTKLLTSTDGTNASIEAASTDGVTDGSADKKHPPHPILAALSLFTNKVNDILFNNLVATNSTEVDYQELNKVYIKEGHRMFGSFVKGTNGELKVMHIENIIPYYDKENTDNGKNDAIPEGQLRN